MASPSTAGQPKRNSSDGLRIILPTPAPSGQLVHPILSASEGLIMASTPPAESSSPRNHLPYDVFISHSGKDTKYTLASSIYKKLDATGLRVFLDQREFEFEFFFPKALEEIIANAALHITIFSQNYARSPWCLAELTFMLQTNIKFIPIFYHVEPSTLRWAIEGKGIYADAFKNYEKEKIRYSTEKLQSWKLALRQVSVYSSLIINSQCDEEKAVMNVVNCVLKELKKVTYVNPVLKELEKVTYDIAKHPVGLDELEQDFHNKIALQSAAGPIQIVGIWGMGGAGKTTLAKYLYNKKCSIFKKSSFLFNVREAARKKLLHEKQMELLKDLGLVSKDVENIDRGKEILRNQIFKKSSFLFDVSEAARKKLLYEKELLKDLDLESKDVENIVRGKEILRNQLRSVSVLIILDDVDHTYELDALLPERDSLGYGSQIIVTTRDLGVLTAWGISTIYKIPTLNPSHAQQLFCWHAFRQPSPLAEFKELSQKFIDACHSLPLSLVVFGSQLYGKVSQTWWQSELDKLSKSKIPDDIKFRLKISYDALDFEEKEMFLDVACFFNGWPCSEAIAIWDGSGWSLHSLQRLVDMCFVELYEKDHISFIRMHHEHLRDLGREIANEKSLYRLWSKHQIIEIQPQQEAIQIRGMTDAFGDNCYLRNGEIRLKTSQGECILAPSSLGLKIFMGDGDFINEEWCELSRELVCFSCVRFAHKNFPSWLPLKKLRILQLHEPKQLEDLWECHEDAPLQLRQLLVREGYELKKISGLQRLRSLETLVINDCTKLNALPSLAKATSLKLFDLRRCIKLKKIESLGSLRSLETLIINDCTEMNTLPSLAEATSLKLFDLRCCTKLKKIQSLGSLRSLETLIINDCTELKTLPSLAEATSLKLFDLRRCNKLKRIESLGSLRSLETVIINDCTELKTLPSLAEATSLKMFDLRRCNKLEKIESLESLRSLETVIISHCPALDCGINFFRRI